MAVVVVVVVILAQVVVAPFVCAPRHAPRRHAVVSSIGGRGSGSGGCCCTAPAAAAAGVYGVWAYAGKAHRAGRGDGGGGRQVGRWGRRRARGGGEVHGVGFGEGVSLSRLPLPARVATIQTEGNHPKPAGRSGGYLHACSPWVYHLPARPFRALPDTVSLPLKPFLSSCQ